MEYTRYYCIHTGKWRVLGFGFWQIEHLTNVIRTQYFKCFTKAVYY